MLIFPKSPIVIIFQFDRGTASSIEGDTTCSEDEYCNIRHSSTKMSVSSEPVPTKRSIPSSLYHGTWPVEKNMWNSEPTSLGHVGNSQKTRDTIMEHQIVSICSNRLLNIDSYFFL